jgi:hypothetical protein
MAAHDKEDTPLLSSPPPPPPPPPARAPPPDHHHPINTLYEDDDDDDDDPLRVGPRPPWAQAEPLAHAYPIIYPVVLPRPPPPLRTASPDLPLPLVLPHAPAPPPPPPPLTYDKEQAYYQRLSGRTWALVVLHMLLWFPVGLLLLLARPAAGRGHVYMAVGGVCAAVSAVALVLVAFVFGILLALLPIVYFLLAVCVSPSVCARTGRGLCA